MIFRKHFRDISHYLLTKSVSHRVEIFPFSYQAKTLDHDVKHAVYGTGQPHSDRNLGEKPGKNTAVNKADTGACGLYSVM